MRDTSQCFVVLVKILARFFEGSHLLIFGNINHVSMIIGNVAVK